MRRVSASTIASAAAVIACSTPCFAEPPGQYIVPVQVTRIKTTQSDAQADALTTVTASELADLPGWSRATIDPKLVEIYGDPYSYEKLTSKKSCPNPPDTACFTRLADEMRTDRFIWGSIEKQGSLAIGELRFWQRGYEEQRVALRYNAKLTDATSTELHGIVRSALMTLTGGKPTGTIVIKAGNVDGEVFIDDERTGTVSKGSASIRIAVGEHKILIRAPGYSSMTGTLIVEVGSAVDFVVEPVATTTSSSTVHHEDRAKPTNGNIRKIAAYSAIGGGGALLLGGLAFSLNINGMNNNADYDQFRKQTSGDVCDAAKSQGEHLVEDICKRAGTYGALQYVFYGLGIGAIGVGSYLLFTSPSAEKKSTAQGRIEIHPTASPNASSIDIKVLF